VKVEGGFHGAHDAVLVKAGSGATTLGIPDSAGVLPDVASHTLQVPYNDPEALEDLLSRRKDVAAFIIEPVMGNIGPVLPDDGYLQGVREITRAHDVLLIFDEVICGYRVGIGGAQEHWGVVPDITTLGKVIGGGLPIGAFGGRKEIMEMVAPQGPVYNAGTFSGNPLSLAAGMATVRWIHDHPGLYRDLEEKTRAIGDAVSGTGRGSFVRLGSMFKLFFSGQRTARLQAGEGVRYGRVSEVLGEDARIRDIPAPLSIRDQLSLHGAHLGGRGDHLHGIQAMSLLIGTRGSALALAQAEKVIALLERRGIGAEKVVISTLGDTVTGVPLHEIGGQGVFVRALDDALLRGEIDAAVHSAKDIPAKRPGGLVTCAVLERDSPADFLVHTVPFHEIRVIGTSSTRRRAQLLKHYPDIGVAPLRGNVDTRLRKLKEGQFDAVVLAEAGLQRLGFSLPGTRLPPETFVPSPNQGTIAVVSREGETAGEIAEALTIHRHGMTSDSRG